MKKIFVVEDDQVINREISRLLTDNGYQVVTTFDFANIASIILAADCDLLLLDINIPVYDGYYVCRQIRRSSQMPIIVVTSRDTELDELMSINIGADDFITKPYQPMILLARINNIFKRISPIMKYSYHDLTLDLDKGVALVGQAQVELTKNEIKILKLLLDHQEKIVKREELIEQLWHCDEFVDDNTLTVNVNRLRKKLKEVGVGHYIKTKRGIGYRLRNMK